MKKLQLFSIILITAVSFTLSSCSDDDSTEANPSQNQAPTTSLPRTISGTVVNMIFTAPQTGSPYSLNQETTFTFSSSGMLFIDQDPAAANGDEISISIYTTEGDEFVWKDETNDLSYQLSLKQDNSINEVNVFKTSTNSFLGQFIPKVDNSGGSNLVAEFEGQYTVSNVEKGTHSRMTLSIDAEGNIDFDNGVQLSSVDFELVSDKRDCCDGIWVDMKPYPSEPYPRVNLFVDPTSGALNKIEYYPEYPAITDRVFVDL